MNFAATYVINLPESMDRWRALQPVLAAMGAANVVQFPGVDGRALGESGLRDMQEAGLLARDLSSFDAQCAPGEIGCALSHAAVLRDIVARDLPHALILEDDIALGGHAKSWKRRAAKAFSDLPDDWELWYLYRCFDIRHRSRRISSQTLIPWTPQGGAAYAVSRGGARKLLDALAPVPSAVDRVYAALVKERAIHAFAASPMLILPGAHVSIINRDNPSKTWVENAVNRPPEFWPDAYLPHLGEQAPRSLLTTFRTSLASATRFLRRRAT